MKNTYDLILFDLDGTLLDTSPGIFNSVRYAEEMMGFSRVSDVMLPGFVGPPPKVMYQKVYSVDEDTALQAARFHREYSRERAIYEAEVYSGIVGLLSTLKSSGYKLGVATLKSQLIAEKMLCIHSLYSYFDCIVGMDAAESLTKEDTIRIAMKSTNVINAVLIGDSLYDYEGAMATGIDFIGVLYGFGLSKKNNYLFPTANTPMEILELL